MEDKIVYPAVFEYGEASIGVSFPDLPGIATSGETLGEAIDMAREAMLFHLEGMIEDGHEFPDVTHPRDIEITDGQFVSMIDCIHPKKVERKNITASSSDWVRIDGLAKAAGMDRSAYMVKSSLCADLISTDFDIHTFDEGTHMPRAMGVLQTRGGEISIGTADPAGSVQPVSGGWEALVRDNIQVSKRSRRRMKRIESQNDIF